MSDESGTSLSLLQRIRNGDNSGWQRVLDLYAPLVRHWCRRWGVEGADADDVLQEVFRAAAQGIGSFRSDREGDTFRGWLRGIARHQVMTYWRARQKLPEAAGGSEAQLRLQAIPGPESAESGDPEEEEEFSALVRRALSQLQGEFEPKTWQAFWRTAVDEQPSAGIAAELGMSANAVRMAKSRVLRRLRQELGDLVS